MPSWFTIAMRRARSRSSSRRLANAESGFRRAATHACGDAIKSARASWKSAVDMGSPFSCPHALRLGELVVQAVGAQTRGVGLVELERDAGQVGGRGHDERQQGPHLWWAGTGMRVGVLPGDRAPAGDVNFDDRVQVELGEVVERVEAM